MGSLLFLETNRPNAKMAATLIFFCLCANQTNQPRSEGTFLLYFVRANEASEANQPKDKRIFFWPPFMHSVHRVVFVLLLDLLAHERVHLVGITIEVTLTSPVKDLEKKNIKILIPVRHGKKVQFNQSVCQLYACLLILFFLHFVGKYY